MRAWFRLRYEGLEHIPRTGPAIVACNHISYLDPLTNASAVMKAGRRPRFLAKDELFHIPVVGLAFRGAKQIPVVRGIGRRHHGAAGGRARARRRRGRRDLPRGHRDDARRPPADAGKTGVVRLSLATGVPITPLASWGSQAVWQKSGKGSLKFGRPVWLRAGPPIDLSARREEAGDAEAAAGDDRRGDGGAHRDGRGPARRVPERWSDDG